MLTAKTLLYKALDYDGFWSISKKRRDSEPSKARRTQLNTLLNAFGISKKNFKEAPIIKLENDIQIISESMYSISGNKKAINRKDYIKSLTDLQYFTYGEFLADIDKNEYSHVINDIVSLGRKIFPSHAATIEPSSLNLKILFQDLYSFRHRAYFVFESSFLKFTQPNEFIFEYAYANNFKQGVSKKMPEYFKEVDDLLCLLIDPASRSFSEAALQYPEFDFDRLDMEYQQHLRSL